MSYDETMIRDVRHNRICRGGSFKTADLTALYCAHRHADQPDRSRLEERYAQFRAA
jgi:hypothetical protein